MRVQVLPPVPSRSSSRSRGQRRRAATLSRWRKRVQVSSGPPVSVAQLAELLILNQRVVGSIPTGDTSRGMAQPGRARLVRNQEVGGSNPPAPTTSTRCSAARSTGSGPMVQTESTADFQSADPGSIPGGVANLPHSRVRDRTRTYTRRNVVRRRAHRPSGLRCDRVPRHGFYRRPTT